MRRLMMASDPLKIPSAGAIREMREKLDAGGEAAKGYFRPETTQIEWLLQGEPSLDGESVLYAQVVECVPGSVCVAAREQP